jgi:iron complex outermembrane receptor protein
LRGKVELENFNLETTTAWMHNKGRQNADADSTNINVGVILFPLEMETISQEIRLLSAGGGRFNWIVGFYGIHFTASLDADLGNPNPGGASLPMVHTYLDPDSSATSFAGFAEGTYQLADPLFLTLGGRYTTEKREFEQAVNGRPLPFGRVGKRFNRATYRVALRYNFADNANVYASYGTGFKSGVYNLVSTSSQPVAPEKINAAEGGIKADPLPWLRTNLSIFHYKYNDMQVQARSNDGASYVLMNAARSKLYGGELETTIVPVDGLNLRAALTYLHGRYEDFPAAQDFILIPGGGNAVTASDASGKKIFRAPTCTAIFGLDWTRDLAEGKFNISGNYFHSGRLYYDFLNRFSQPPYDMVSGQLSWTTPDDHLKYSLWVTNLTNEKAAQQIRQGALATDILYEKPRIIGVGVEYRF